MQPLPPLPYGRRTYARPATPVRYARRIAMRDGAAIATFVYGREETPLNKLLARDPVLALHGNGGSHATFVSVIDKLCAAGLGVVALDARGQGQSTRGRERLTYDLLARDALEVLDALDISAAHVLGHSDGGIEALLLARDHAERVLSIVAGGANLTPEGVIDEWDTPGSAQAQRAWSSWMRGNEVPAEVDASLLPSAEEAALSAELLQLMLHEPHIEAATLAAIRCPACVLVGEHDCIARSETEAIATHILGARLVTVAGAGHGLPRHAPDSVALEVLTNVVLARGSRS